MELLPYLQIIKISPNVWYTDCDKLNFIPYLNERILTLGIGVILILSLKCCNLILILFSKRSKWILCDRTQECFIAKCTWPGIQEKYNDFTSILVLRETKARAVGWLSSNAPPVHATHVLFHATVGLDGRKRTGVDADAEVRRGRDPQPLRHSARARPHSAMMIFSKEKTFRIKYLHFKSYPTSKLRHLDITFLSSTISPHMQASPPITPASKVSLPVASRTVCRGSTMYNSHHWFLGHVRYQPDEKSKRWPACSTCAPTQI